MCWGLADPVLVHQEPLDASAITRVLRPAQVDVEQAGHTNKAAHRAVEDPPLPSTRTVTKRLRLVRLVRAQAPIVEDPQALSGREGPDHQRRAPLERLR